MKCLKIFHRVCFKFFFKTNNKARRRYQKNRKKWGRSSSSLIKMPSKVISSNGKLISLEGHGDQEESLSEVSEEEDQFDFIPPPPPAYQYKHKINSMSDRTSLHNQKVVNRDRKKGRSVSQGHGCKSHMKPHSGVSGDHQITYQGGQSQQQTSNTKNSNSTASSTEDRMKEVETPILRLYQIKTRLGKGAYGIVWEAIQYATGMRVALKKIYDGFRNSTDAQRTYREIMFLREFGHHPHMINLISVHKASNAMDLYLVFPYMDHDLHKLIKCHSHFLTDLTIRKIIYEILIALIYLHSAEVIHRDLKPANILMDQNLTVKLADFGLARSLSVSPEDSIAFQDVLNPVMTDYVATRWYRPPEILLNCKMYTKGVDMWSVGCILAEMLLRKPLFPGGNTNEQIEMIMKSIKAPTEEEIQEMCEGTACKANVSIVKAGMETQGDSIEMIFNQFDLSTVDYLERLMLFCPAKRLTIQEALMHPFVSTVRQPHREWVCDRLVRPPLSDYVKLEMEDYRQTIYEMIDRGEFVANDLQQPLEGPSLYPHHQSHDHVGQVLHEIPEDFLEESIEFQQGSQSGSEVHQEQQFNSIQIQDPYYYNNEAYYNSTQFEKQTEVPVEYTTSYQDISQAHSYNAYQQKLNYVSADDNFSNKINEDRNNNNSYNNSNDILNSRQKNPILTKSHSDSTTNTSMAAAANNNHSTHNHWVTNERTPKTLSILTIPSETPPAGVKPLTIPSSYPSQQSLRSNHSSYRNNNSIQGKSMGTNTELEDEDDDESFSCDVPEIIEKFQDLCNKYDVKVGKMGPLGDYITEKKDLQRANKKKAAKETKPKKPSEVLYEYLPLKGDIFGESRGMAGKTTSTAKREGSGGSWNHPINQQLQSILPPLKERAQVDYGTKLTSTSMSNLSQYKRGQPLLEIQSQGGGHSNQQSQRHPKYPSDVQKLNDSMGNDDLQPKSSGFYNPYKPKGIKTSSTEDSLFFSKITLDDGLGDIYEEFESQNKGSTQMNLSRGIEDQISFTLGTKNQSLQPQQRPYQSYPGYGNHKPGTNKGQSNTTYHQQQGRVQELFHKDGAQDRLSRGKASGSRDFLHTSILINGKNNASSNNRQKKTMEAPKSKLTFNRPGKKEEPQAPVRPYGGRQYGKKFHGPSFRRTGLSYSDSETNHGRSWKTNSVISLPETNLRPTSDAELIRKPLTHSAYFPHSGVTHPMNNLNRGGGNKNTQMESALGPSRNGFAIVHPVNSNSRGSERSLGYRHTRSPLQPQYSSSSHYYEGGHEGPATSGSGTIRASDLFELRNNVTRDKRKARSDTRNF